MPPQGPAIGEDTAPGRWSAAFLTRARCSVCLGKITGRVGHQQTPCLACATHTDHLRWPLPAHRRGTLPDLERHGCRARAYTDVPAACPAMVGGQGPCSQPADQSPETKAQLVGSAIDRLGVVCQPPKPSALRHTTAFSLQSSVPARAAESARRTDAGSTSAVTRTAHLPVPSRKPLSPRRCLRSRHPDWQRYSRPAGRCIPGFAGRSR